MSDDAPGSTGRPLLSAESLIAWRGDFKGRVPKCVILTHQESLFRSLAPRLRSKSVKGLFPKVRIVPETGGRVAIAGGIGIGGPATAMAVEELAAAGVEYIVMVDAAASIVTGLPSEVVIVVTEAIAADGTSPHYLQEGEAAVAGSETLLIAIDTQLRRDDEARRAEQTVSARVASVDAPFRETDALIDSFRGRGAIAVDMETAAFYSSAAARGVSAASVLVIGDQISSGRWTPPPSHESVRAQLRRVAGIVRDVLLFE